MGVLKLGLGQGQLLTEAQMVCEFAGGPCHVLCCAHSLLWVAKHFYLPQSTCIHWLPGTCRLDMSMVSNTGMHVWCC
jgi:hypothetical protein